MNTITAWVWIILCGECLQIQCRQDKLLFPFNPMLCTAAIRLLLVFCNLVREAHVDGKLDTCQVFASGITFASDVFVTMNTVFPQPVFMTFIGGTFESGDAARSFHMRMSRFLWRLTVRLPVDGASLFVYLLVAIFTYGACKDIFKDVAPSLRMLGKGVVLSIFWTVFVARVQMLPFGHVLGFDPSSSLATYVPDELLMFRRKSTFSIQKCSFLVLKFLGLQTMS